MVVLVVMLLDTHAHLPRYQLMLKQTLASLAAVIEERGYA